MHSRGTFLYPLAGVVVANALVAADVAAPRRAPQPRDFDLPAGDASETLRRFATASGEQIVFLVETVRGERTHAVVGRYSAREALERMLAGTALVMAEDPTTGAFFVGRKRTTSPTRGPMTPPGSHGPLDSAPTRG